MSIVCGTDFSEMAGHAATAAACLAARTGVPLHLVHALDLRLEQLEGQPGHPVLLWAENRLAREAERLRALGADVREHAVAGPADEVVSTTAREVSASMILVGALGNRGRSARNLGSRADRTAQRSHVPVLVIRDATPFLAWLREGRMLRVVLGVDATESAENAGRWLGELCRLGDCEVVLAHLYWPPEASQKFGLGGARNLVDPDAETVQALEQQFSKTFGSLLFTKLQSYRIEPHLGRVGDGLAALALAARADLLVLGCHHQSLLERAWEGSVTRQVLHASSLSVACVPTPAGARALHTPRLRNVLAATDFTALGNGAIPLAYAAASNGGTVHLVHVVKAERGHADAYDVFNPLPNDALSEAGQAAAARLAELVPTDGSGKTVATRIHVLTAPDPATAICQAAERLGVDLLCVGTHGRTGLARAALGSVAAAVLAGTRRPVLVAKSPRP